VVLLLPHGFEGQGPDHSSARIERFLQLAAEDNMILSRPSTPASYFHLLRRQAYARPRKPLVVFTPKAMLRLRGATSGVEDFTAGKFQPVLDDPAVSDASEITKVLMVAGKIYYDLQSEIAKRDITHIALVRLEQYYPFPGGDLQKVVARYPNATYVWVQDEPENQGAWPFMMMEARAAGLPPLSVVSRTRSASPATWLVQAQPGRSAADNRPSTRVLTFSPTESGIFTRSVSPILYTFDDYSGICNMVGGSPARSPAGS